MDGPPPAIRGWGTIVRMILKLDPRLPLVWRSPSSVQLGVDPAVVRFDDVTDMQERILAALAVGVSEPGLAMIAREAIEERDAMLERLAPALAAPERVEARPTVAVSGTEPLVTAVSTVLAESGIRVVAAADPDELTVASPDLAILEGHFVLAPELHAFWLRRDVPHIPVVFSDTGVEVGPVIEPGDGPCLLCIELHRRDADPAWPAIATQLLGRRSRAASAVLVAEATATVSRMTVRRLDTGTPPARSVRIDAASGDVLSRDWAVHPECGCRGIQHLVSAGADPAGRGRPGSDSAAGPRLAPAFR